MLYLRGKNWVVGPRGENFLWVTFELVCPKKYKKQNQKTKRFSFFSFAFTESKTIYHAGKKIVSHYSYLKKCYGSYK